MPFKTVADPCLFNPCLFCVLNENIDIQTFNCAGLATRNHSIKSLAQLKKFLTKENKLDNCGEKCKPCQLKFFLWEFNLHFEAPTLNNNPRTDPTLEFHVVAGRVHCKDGTDLPNVISKNGFRPIEGPNFGISFWPKNRERNRINDETNKLLYVDPKTLRHDTVVTPHPLIGVHTNIKDTCYCLDDKDLE